MASRESNKVMVAAFMEEFAATGRIDQSRFTDDATWWTPSTGELPIAQHADQTHWVAESLFAGPGRFEIVSITAEDDRVAVEAKGIQPLTNGRCYENDYLWLIGVREGKIRRLRAYLDPRVAERAFRGN